MTIYLLIIPPYGKSEERARRRRLIQDVSAILAHHDPVQYIACYGCPSDEYDSEAETIVERWTGDVSPYEMTKIVHEEFVDCFGADLAGPVERYAQIAEDILSLRTER